MSKQRVLWAQRRNLDSVLEGTQGSRLPREVDIQAESQVGKLQGGGQGRVLLQEERAKAQRQSTVPSEVIGILGRYERCLHDPVIGDYCSASEM